MSRCIAYTKKGVRCKIKCKNKYCRYHCKKTGGYKNPMKQQYLKPYKCDCKSCPTGCVSSCSCRRGGAKKKISYKPMIDLNKYPQVVIEQKKGKHNNFFVNKGNANKFCAMSDVRPGQAAYSFEENKNGLVASIDGEPVGFLLFTPKSRMKISGGNYMYLELICTSRYSPKRKDKKTGKNIPIGTLLLTKFEQIALSLGYPKLKGESVKGAIKFYEKNGWTVKKDSKNSMTKKLA